MKPVSFDYHAPTSVEEAVGLLAELGDEAKLLAGGQSLIPMLALRLTQFAHLIDIARIEALRGVMEDQQSVRIGAGTTEAVIGGDPAVAAGVPLLARATPLIGHFQIRNRGTLGGSIAHADPAAEFPAVAIALDAEIEVASPRGERVVPASQFFTGLWSTDLADDEVVTAVRFAKRGDRSGYAIHEVTRRHGDFAIAGATVAVELDGDDRVARCGIGLIGMGSTPERATIAEQAVTGRPVGDLGGADIAQLAVAGLDSIPSDLHGTAEYRRRVGAEMVARAWHDASEEAARA